jgi:hypothetical protein
MMRQTLIIVSLVAMTPARVQPLFEEKTGDGAETAAVTGGIVLGAANLEPPDFELRIALSADRRTLTYTLHSPAGSRQEGCRPSK